jgi:hypothetical protein
VRLDTYQRVIAVLLLIYMSSRALHPLEWLTHQGFHYSTATQNYWEPAPFPLLPPPLVPVFLGVYFLAIGCLVIGWRARAMIWVALAGLVYVTFADTASAFTVNRLFIVILGVLALAPRPLPCRVDGETLLRQSAWPLRTLQLTLVIQLTTAGWCKLTRGTWLEDPYTVWSQSQGYYMTDFAAWMLATLPKEAWIPMQWSSLGFELVAPILFLVPPLQPIGILWGIAFHGMIALTMHKIVFLSSVMVAFYVLFVSADRLHALRDWLPDRFTGSRPTHEA